MLRMVDIFDGAKIVSFRTSDYVGEITEPIIKPGGLKLVGFFVRPIRGGADKVLVVDDIRELAPEGVLIDDAERLMDLEDLVRIQEIVDLNFVVIGKKVITKKKDKIGRVNDYAVDDIDWKIQKLYVGKNAIKSIATNGRIIDRKQIKEVTDRYIIVKDAEEKVAKGAWATSAT